MWTQITAINTPMQRIGLHGPLVSMPKIPYEKLAPKSRTSPQTLKPVPAGNLCRIPMTSPVTIYMQENHFEVEKAFGNKFRKNENSQKKRVGTRIFTMTVGRMLFSEEILQNIAPGFLNFSSNICIQISQQISQHENII